MKLRLRRHEDPAGGIERLISRGAARVGALLAKKSRLEAEEIHQVRVCTKRLRAILRLLDAVEETKSRRPFRKQLAEIARNLGRVRDFQVALSAAEVLRISRNQSSRLRRHFELHGTRDFASTPAIKNAVPLMEKLTREILRTLPGKLTRRMLRGGLRVLWRRARKAWRRAEKSSTQESLHRLRKRTKDLVYAMEAAGFVKDGGAPAALKRLRRLAATLGRFHDQVVLRNKLADFGTERVRKALLQRSMENGERLKAEALRRARRIFSDKKFRPI